MLLCATISGRITKAVSPVTFGRLRNWRNQCDYQADVENLGSLVGAAMATPEPCRRLGRPGVLDLEIGLPRSGPDARLSAVSRNDDHLLDALRKLDAGKRFRELTLPEQGDESPSALLVQIDRGHGLRGPLENEIGASPEEGNRITGLRRSPAT